MLEPKPLWSPSVAARTCAQPRARHAAPSPSRRRDGGGGRTRKGRRVEQHRGTVLNTAVVRAIDPVGRRTSGPRAPEVHSGVEWSSGVVRPAPCLSVTQQRGRRRTAVARFTGVRRDGVWGEQGEQRRPAIPTKHALYRPARHTGEVTLQLMGFGQSHRSLQPLVCVLAYM